ncbi:hypothetical protein [Microbacterium sp. No. 7]|uniref:hypothetical protein n=1 Tax=Microbacterium sp. No. 7 TaxID=1714373 RepID=UPI0006D1C8E5|nr:hypothetical protein [Microbacterium sp. No. 7]ALJ21517.1 hypothetical protein AOA12_17110 [Microbacterium sp. No. 7]
MRLREALGEAARNLMTGTSRGGVLVIVAWALATALLASDAAAIASLQARALELRAQAGNVRVVVAEDAIDPRACARLEELNGVTSAGAVWALDAVALSALPGISTPAFRVSPGVAEMLGFPGFQVGGLYLPQPLVERWHAPTGTTLSADGGGLHVAGTFDYTEEDGRDPRLASAVVIAGDSPERASECWFSVWHPTRAMDRFALGTVVASTSNDSGAQVVALNSSVGDKHDLAREFTDRVTRALAPFVVVLFGALGFGGMHLRRIEIASGLHAGARRRDIALIVGAETGAWALTAGVATFACVRFIAAAVMPEPLPSYEPSLAAVVCAAVAGAVFGALLVVAVAREDRLFTIFKARS